jgi:hypothetical protein
MACTLEQGVYSRTGNYWWGESPEEVGAVRASEIETLVRCHHDETRRLMDELDQPVRRYQNDEGEFAETARQRGRDLHRRLSEYAVLEDAMLTPHVPRGAREVLANHRKQRESLVASLVSAVRDAGRGGEMAGSVRALVALLREQTDQEERDLLGSVLGEEPLRHKGLRGGSAEKRHSEPCACAPRGEER